MKGFFSVKNLCLSGVIAALYAGLTLLLQAISFGPLQLRIAEAMTLLPLLTPAAIPGLAVGCFAANLLCSVWQDWVFGTLATLLAALLTFAFRKKPLLAAAMPVLCNGLIVGGMMYALYGGSLILHVLSVGAGEAAVCFGLGLPLVRALKAHPKL